MGTVTMEKEKKAKIDNLMYGILFGVVLPIIGFYLSYFVKTRGTPVDFDMYMRLAFHSNEQQQDILIFCLIPNMFMFYISNFRYRWMEFTKGLVGTTIIGLLALIFLTY